MNILMTGGTGFIGSRLTKQLVQEGHHIYVLTRHPKKHADTEYISFISSRYPMKKLPFIHAVINLAGESLFGYWSEAKKAKILNSRITTTDKLTNILMQMDKKPNVFISGSAIGYYGISDEKIFTEETRTPGEDYLATVCATWEKSASIAADLGIRTVFTRFGIILDNKHGALPMMALPFKLGAGGKIGSGMQWMSWVHIDDCIQLILHALHNQNISGSFNITAPNPKQNAEFSNILAKTLKRPAIIKTPELLFKIALGEMHQLVTTGQYVYPKKALDNGFEFQYAHLDDALRAIYN